MGPAMVYAMPLPGITERSSSRNIERAAVAHIIKHVFGSDAELMHTPDGAPYLSDYKNHISISHGGGYALLAVCDSQAIGVDIECYRPQLKRVAPKFLAPSEQDIYSQSESLLLQAWTSKEAIFKALGISSLTISEIILPQDPEVFTFTTHGRLVTLYQDTLSDSMITLATTNSL